MERIKLTILLVLLIAAPAMAQNNDLFSETGLTTYLKTQRFSGSVLAKQSSGEIVQVVSGASDLEGNTAIDPNAKFKIASITKLFTAAITMQLVDEGKLSLNSTIDDLLDYDMIEFAKQITVADLLKHTSGLKKETNLSYLKHYEPSELISRFGAKKAIEPGNKFNYNNVDYLILGEMIEKVTGKTYQQNLEERILSPLSMNNSGLITTHELPSEIVPSYKMKNDKRRADLKIHTENFWAAGSMYSTVSDLLLFVDALKSGELVSTEGLKTMFDSSPQSGYAAMGCWTFNSPFIKAKPRVMERRGEILGATSVIMTNLNGPETVIILSNTNEFRPETFGVQDNTKEYLFKQLFAESELD